MVAAATMSALLIFGTGPLELIPKPALGAILVLAGAALFDVRTVREIFHVHRSEFALSVFATLGVATIGVLAGIVLAVLLSIVMLLLRAANPSDAVLGRVSGMDGYADTNEFPDAKTIPGILIYRFDAALVFFNAEYFKRRIRETIARTSPTPRHFVFDMEAINGIDVTGIESLEEIRSELARKDIDFSVVRAKVEVRERISRAGVAGRIGEERFYQSVRSAVQACSGQE
jgi:MFS superfamily sulfate permease-like transporter